jgi:hypothetical protein
VVNGKRQSEIPATDISYLHRLKSHAKHARNAKSEAPRLTNKHQDKIDKTNSPQSTVIHVQVSRLAYSCHPQITFGSRRKLRSLYQEVASLRDVFPTYHAMEPYVRISGAEDPRKAHHWLKSTEQNHSHIQLS